MLPGWGGSDLHSRFSLFLTKPPGIQAFLPRGNLAVGGRQPWSPPPVPLVAVP